MKSGEQQAALNQVGAEVAGAIRGALIQPGGSRAGNDRANHRTRLAARGRRARPGALGELRTALNVKLKSEAEAIRRLSVGLEGFERRLTQMARRHLDSRPEGR
jgi:hypothetical protein